MSRPAKGILLFSPVVEPGFAATLFSQGTFAADDHELFHVTANTSEAITVQMDSSACGTANSAIIPAGGLAPTASLFDNLGHAPTLTNRTCGQVGLEPTTGSCDALDFRDKLGPCPASGRRSSITRREAGSSGSFCDLTTALGAARTGN